MQVDHQDSININFDTDWKGYCQYSNDRTDERTMILAANDTTKDDRWLSIRLPHITGMNENHKHQGLSSYEWWYCKQFAWMSSDQRLGQQVYLMFEQSGGLYEALSPSDLTGTIWLNGTQIYLGSLISPNELIELPAHLLRNENTAEKNHYNILIIRCSNDSLSLRTCLTFRGSVICATGKLDMNEAVDGKTADTNQKEDNVLNYTVSVDDNDGRIDLVFNSKKKYPAPVKPSPPLARSPGADCDEKLEESTQLLTNDVLVPRLAIVILIVGTRGDVQPFIA